ncbi:tyrosine-type recombinase/integrase [Curtobacterium flaccumfaciens pv. flaccumfaciens]|uniref:tyrosine-type recombinase/integrase n=1 Tax=Curtobacterium poinsettiae TaxID=159612 RepID=UPI00217F17F6|nr:tyrosine-type recombinase/integrase [Curtobacterium flaccumfaciens]MCS6565611.1 tyrosine-type recombinase/integrase [Curtobacterium flaccumfaciens pv. flaccumfaciens]
MTWHELVSGLSVEHRAALAAALADVAVDDGQPLELWLRDWFPNIHSKKIAPKTIASYRTSIEQYIVPAIGTVGLRALTPTHVGLVEKFIRDRGLGGASAQQAYRVLSLALRDAVRYEHIPRNVATLVGAPKKKLAQLVALTADDGARILETVQHDRLGSRIAAALLTGARQGELLGLELERVADELDLSWQLKRFSWSHGCTKHSSDRPRCGARQGAKCPGRHLDAPEDQEFRHLTGGLWLSRPKSAAGWRVVPLVDPLRSIIEQRVQVAAEEPNPHGLLWTSDPKRTRQSDTLALDGSPIDPRVDNEYWHDVLKRAQVRDARLHDARHAAVDLLYAADVSEVVIGDIVGHSTVTMSRAYRSRGDRSSQRAALEAMARLVTPTDPPSSTGGTP